MHPRLIQQGLGRLNQKQRKSSEKFGIGFKCCSLILSIFTEKGSWTQAILLKVFKVMAVVLEDRKPVANLFGFAVVLVFLLKSLVSLNLKNKRSQLERSVVTEG